jgi:hypothetical protein
MPAESAAVRSVLASCRASLGSLLRDMGRTDESLSMLKRAWADQESLADAPGATAESRRDLAATIQGTAVV